MCVSCGVCLVGVGVLCVFVFVSVGALGWGVVGVVRVCACECGCVVWVCDWLSVVSCEVGVGNLCLM